MRQVDLVPPLMYVTILIARPSSMIAQAEGTRGDTAALRADVNAFVSDFRARTRVAGTELTYSPRVRLRNTPQLIFFNDTDSTIVVPWWAGLEPSTQESFNVLAQDASQGRCLFLELFNWFLLPHELTHALQAQYARPWRPYASEAEANVGAVAYWMAAGAERRLQRLDSALARALTRLPDPTPPGRDAATYFDQNYDALSANPQAYGYYQFHFIRAAIANRHGTTFEALLHRIAKMP